MTEKTLVYIGRFAPFHKGHKAVIEWALGQNPDKLLIIIGSANAARSYRTPFTAQEREKMIRGTFPTELKIDIAFIREVTTNPQDAAIARTIIELAHSLNLQVIAEGVETPEQLDFLKKNGCDQVQGYLFSKPLPVLELEAYLRERGCFT